MAETKSEKWMKDTLHRLQHEDKIIYKHKERTPQYFKEKVDFYCVDNSSRTHLIEVKETGAKKSISPSQFNERQRFILKHPLLNEKHAHTRVWAYVRFYDDDTTKRSKDHYDYNFLVPGWWIGEKTISLDMFGVDPESDGVTIKVPHKDVHLLSVYKNRSWHGMSEEYGRTTNGNESLGFESIPVLEVE